MKEKSQRSKSWLLLKAVTVVVERLKKVRIEKVKKEVKKERRKEKEEKKEKGRKRNGQRR